MYKITLTKKDIIAFNQEIGEEGQLRNESSLDFALAVAKSKRNWLYELSYITRTLLVDHAFNDGNKRTCFVIVRYYSQEYGWICDPDKLMGLIHRIARKNIGSPVQIMRLLRYALRKKN